jgi:phosphatidylcholine synthase
MLLSVHTARRRSRAREAEAALSIERDAPRVRQAAGFSVHLFTASGSAVALLALYAAIDRNFPACFAWLGLALLIDGVDGTLARVARVTETASAIDGAILDLVIDFLTYVLVPMVALWRSDLMPVGLSFWLSVIVVFASGLYFADTRMKTRDYWFRGFPALWNVLAIYLFVLRPPAFVSAALILIGVAAMFAPVVFVHPMRVKELRLLNLFASVAFFVLSAAAIAQDFAAALWVKLGFVVVAVYFLAAPFWRHSPWADD